MTELGGSSSSSSRPIGPLVALAPFTSDRERGCAIFLQTLISVCSMDRAVVTGRVELVSVLGAVKGRCVEVCNVLTTAWRAAGVECRLSQ